MSVKRDWGRNLKLPNANGEYRCSLCRTWKEPKHFNKNKFQNSGEYKDRVCVDHNHNTGEIRGLVCHKCNLAAGNVNDSSSYALQVARYLEKWNC